MTIEASFFYIGIGASAGGHEALVEFFSNLPPDTKAAYFISTHLPRFHKTELTEIIRLHTRMPVIDVDRPLDIQHSSVYMPAENTLMSFQNASIVSPQRILAGTLTRTVDVFFTSLAECFKRRAMGIILSGAGSDGATGAIEIHKYGGQILVQSPPSSLFTAMPYATIHRDHPMFIDTPARLAAKVAQLVGITV